MTLQYWTNELQKCFTGLAESITEMIHRQIKYEKGVAEAYVEANTLYIWLCEEQRKSGIINTNLEPKLRRLTNLLEELTKNV